MNNFIRQIRQRDRQKHAVGRKSLSAQCRVSAMGKLQSRSFNISFVDDQAQVSTSVEQQSSVGDKQLTSC